MTIRAEVEGVGVLEFPDGTDPIVIRQTVSRIVAKGTPEQRTRALYGGEPQSPLTQAPLNQMGNVMRGGVDVLGGGAQLLSRGANALGIVPESNPDSFFAGPKEVDAQNAQARSNIDRVFGASEGFSPVRAASAGMLSMPFGPTKFVEAPTAIGRAIGASKMGATSAAVQEVESPKSGGDYWARKGIQVGAGAVTAGLAQPVAEKVVSAVVSALNKGADRTVAGIRDMTGANSIDKVVSMTREALRKSGVEYDNLSDATKSALLGDVQKALSSYSGINSGAVARQAAFREEGFDPLRHWVTRDPGEFTALENLSHQPSGDPLKQRKADLDKLVMDRFNGMRGSQPIPQEVGGKVAGDLRGYLEGQQGKTNVLYDTFREIAPNAKGDPQRFVNDVFGGLDGQMALGSLPDGLKNILNKISAGEVPLTPSVLYQMQKMAKPGSDGSANYALGHLRKAIDREMGAISESVGAMDRSLPVPAGVAAPPQEGKYAADVLKMARGQHAKVRGEVDESRILASVEDGSAIPENLTDKLLGSSLKELAATWGKLGEDAKSGVRAQVLDELKRKTFGGASDEAGAAARQARLNEYLSDPTTAQKLRVVLGDKGLQEVKRLALMLESAHLQPSGSAVNNSKTGGALLGGMSSIADAMKAKAIPGGTALQDTVSRGVAQAAQRMPPEAIGSQSLMIDPFIEEIMKRRAGQMGGLFGASSAYPFLDGLFGR